MVFDINFIIIVVIIIIIIIMIIIMNNNINIISTSFIVTDKNTSE